MADIINSIYKMKYMDELSAGNSPIHRLHPVIKIIVTLLYVITIASFGKYDFLPLLPYLIYPVMLFTLSDSPYGAILKRALYVSPLILGIGVFNPILDTNSINIIGNFYISAGWISYFVLILKSFLCVTAALLLLAVTGMDKIAFGLRQLKVPKIFILQLSLTYRYITVLAEEAARIYTAYKLRAPDQKGVNIKISGSLAGQLLIRTFSKAERVYYAMKLRGFDGDYKIGSSRKLSRNDLLYLIIWITFFLIARLINIPIFIGNIVTIK